MSAAGFRGRGGIVQRGKKVRGLTSGVVGSRIPQPNFNEPRRGSLPVPSDFWLDHQTTIPPWQQIGGLPPPPPQAQQYPGFETLRYRGGGGRPQFCPNFSARGGSKRIRGKGRLQPGILPACGFTGMGFCRSQSEPLRFPPLGSEEERQQKIAETADKLKQKLSLLNIEEPLNFWEDDSIGVNFCQEDEPVVSTRGIPELRHDPPELNLTVNDFKDIGRVDPESCGNPGEPAEVVASEETISRVQSESRDSNDSKISIKSDHRNNKTSDDEITEISNNAVTSGEVGVDGESSTVKRRRENEFDESAIWLFRKISEEDKSPTRLEKAALKVIEKRRENDLKPELSKSLKKLREVIKVDRELKKERKSSSQVENTESRTIFQPSSHPRLQMDVGSDYQPGVITTYPRFQGVAHRENRNRFRRPFRPEHAGELQQQNFPPDFQQRFDPDLRDLNVSQRPLGPRMMYAELERPVPVRGQNKNSDLPRGFDSWEPVSRFNGPQRQDHLENSPWFNRNELSQKFIQPPLGFHPRVSPQIFISRDQEMNTFGQNILPNSEFPGIVPMGYTQVQHIHMGQPGYYNPAMPPPNTAPCIIHEYQQHSVPSSSSGVENRRTIQLPSIPSDALDIRPSSPPKSTQIISNPKNLVDEDPAPNMNEELEDMQEALKFAKQLMNMTEEEELQTPQAFDMPTFPDLPPIMSTTEDIQTVHEPGNILDRSMKYVQCPQTEPPSSFEESTSSEAYKSKEGDKTQVDLPEHQDRAKVTLNLNSRTKRMAANGEWKLGDKEISSSSKSEERSSIETKLRENKNNRKNKVQLKEDEKFTESRDSQLSSTGDSSGQNRAEISGKTLDNNLRGRAASGSKSGGKSMSASVVDTNWKDKVINQFLKMSKNDICNMVNSSGLRKFDIAMKHLVRERKNSLSHERRCSADEAVKGEAYDMSREEFMSQLSAMLDPSATVDVNNLPAKFIQHLSEVLKLDVESHLNDAADNIADPNNPMENFESIEDHNNYFADFRTKVEPPREMRSSQFHSNFFGDTDDGIISQVESMPAISNTFSARVARTKNNSRKIEGEFITHGFIRARCTRSLLSEENYELNDIYSTEMETRAQMAQTNAVGVRSDLSETRIDDAETWGRQKHQDSDLFRNFTKEEWEARCGASIDSFHHKKRTKSRSRTPSSRDTSLSARSRSPKTVDRSSIRSYTSRNFSPASPLRENNYNLNMIVHTTKDAVDQWSKAMEEESKRCDCSDISSDSNHSSSSNAIKLLKVIEGREKIAEDMTLGKTLRNEIAAEMKSEREKNRRLMRKVFGERRKAHREKRKSRRTNRASENFRVNDRTRIPFVNHTLEQEEDRGMKHEELMIEAENERFFETGNDLAALEQPGNINSNSAIDTNEETMSEIAFRENNHAPAVLHGTPNTQEMIATQDYENRSNMSKLGTESSMDSHRQSHTRDQNNAEKNAQIGSKATLEKPRENFESQEIRDTVDNRPSQSRVKKIDIEAYKARKLKRNNEWEKKESRETKASVDGKDLVLQRSIQDGKETQKEETPSIDSSQKPCGEKFGDGNYPGGDSESRSKFLHNEKIPPRRVKHDEKRDAREGRRHGEETSTRSDRRKGRTESQTESGDKKRSKTSTCRSTSQDNYRKSSRDKSKRSSRERHHRSARSASLDKSRTKASHRNNNVIEFKNGKMNRHRHSDRSERSRERSHFGCKKNIDDKSVVEGGNDTVISQKILDRGEVLKDDISLVQYSQRSEEASANDGGISEETRAIETDKALSASLGIASSEFNTDNVMADCTQIPVNIDPPTSPDLNTTLGPNEESMVELIDENPNVETESNTEKTRTDAGEELNDEQNRLIQNEDKNDEGVSEPGDLKDAENELASEFQRKETPVQSYSPKSKSMEQSSTLKADEKPKQSKDCENEVMIILDDLIDEVISRLDLVTDENAVVETVVTRATGDLGVSQKSEASLELCSPIEDKPDLKKSEEYNTAEINSPQTPGSPLKGFSEESIKSSSILGKRRLVESVFEITEDLLEPNKKSEDNFDDSMREADQVSGQDFSEQVSSEERKIDSGEAVEDCSEKIVSVEAENRQDKDREQCATPCSVVDFQNDEFIVLSEISLAENFSQNSAEVDQEREISSLPENQNISLESLKSKDDEKNRTQESPETTTKTPEAVNDEKLKEDDKSECSVSDKNQEKLSLFSQHNAKLFVSEHTTLSSEPESNFGHEDTNEKTNDTANEDLAPNASTESPEETTGLDARRQFEESQTSSKHGENEGPQSSSKKSFASEDDNSGKKVSKDKKSSKSDETRSVKESNRDISSGENSSSKNLHKVKHRHKMTRKKDKKSKLGERQIMEVLRDGELVSIVKKQQTREGVMARMVEIDLEIHKLMSEKMKLYEMLKSEELPNEQSHSAAKDGPKPILEIVNVCRELDPIPSSSSTKQKASGSQNVAETPQHSKSTKIGAVPTSEEDPGSHRTGNQKDASLRKSETSRKHEKSSKPDKSVQNESRKSLAERSACDDKTSISKRKHNEEKSSRKRDSHSRSSSRSNRKKDEEREQQNTVVVETEALDEDGVCQRSKKPDHHSTQITKINKTSDLKEEPVIKVKNEGLFCGSNNETEPPWSKATPESLNLTVEKQPPKIKPEESSQGSAVSQENKGSRKMTKGLDSLKESYKRNKAASKKRRSGICRVNEEELKSVNLLSPGEEEMPLNVRYVKKFKKRDPASILKLKRTKSTEILDHVLEVINVMAKNKTRESHRRSNKVRVKTKVLEEPNPNRKAKITGKSNNTLEQRPNSAIDQSPAISSFRDIPGGNNSLDNDFGNSEIPTSSTSPPRDIDNKFPVEKIVEIARKNNGSQITRSRSRAKSAGSKRRTDRLSLCRNAQRKEIGRTVQASDGRSSRLDTHGIEALGYMDVVPQFDDYETIFPSHDPIAHGHPTSRNINDTEEGLDVLDSILENVSSDLEGISSKDVHSSGSMKRHKRKLKGSGVEGDVSSKKKNSIIRSEIRNCSVKLVDCKYTYLKNCFNLCAGQRFTILSTEETSISDLLPRSSGSNHSVTHDPEKSCAPISEPESPVLQLPASGESEDWLLEGDHLASLNRENYFSADCDLGLNPIEENTEYDADDLEIIKSNRSSLSTEYIVVEPFSPEAATPEIEDWPPLDKIRKDGFGAHTMSKLHSELVQDPEISEIKRSVSTKPFSKVVDLEEVNRSPPPISRLDSPEEEILDPESNYLVVIGEEGAAAACEADIEIVNPPENEETSSLQATELPRIQYSVHKGPILDVKVFGDSILAASEDGLIYRYSQTCNGILNTYEGHKSAVTCILVIQGSGATGISKNSLFSSSLDGSLRCFDIMTSHQFRGTAGVGSPVQCMDQSWGEIFLGTKSGYVFRFHIKSHSFKGDEIKFSEESVLALKATTEGPRRVLIVASRSQPITIRDAQSGLFLRTLSGHKSHTVYSLMMDNNLVYCGTSGTAIPVFDFINGSQVHLYNAGPGIVCMRMYKWLLFAGCYDGNIYVFDTKEERLVCSIPGPGNMLLSMDIVKNKIVAGSKDRRLHMWQMPDQVLKLLACKT